MTRRFTTIAVLVLLGSILAYAGGRSEPADRLLEYPIDVVATTGMIGDIVPQVAGEYARVHVLMGEEVDPHLYRPTRADIARMQRADIVFYNGLYLEGRMGDTLAQLSRTRPVFPVAELAVAGLAADGIDEQSVLLDDEEYDGTFDPHLWMDVSLWMRVVDVVRDALAELDPPNAETYRENATVYREELAELDRYVREIVATIPEERRVLVTAHDAFGYFGAAYEVEVLGVQGISTESEAGLEDINALVRFLVDRGVNAVFAETTVPDRALSAVIEGAAARDHRVVVGGNLFSDAMGPAGSWEGTYMGMIDHNATTIVRALGGSAPERGFTGRLSGGDGR